MSINPHDELKSKLNEMLQYSGHEALKVKSGINSKHLPSNPNALSFSKWYAKEVEFLSSEINKIEERFNMKSTCSTGCNHCCKHPIFLSSTDIKILAPFFKNLSKENKIAVKTKVEAACKKILEIFGEVNINNVTKGEDAASFKDGYFKANIMCPLLDEEGNCSVYQVRPTTCWAYKNYGSADRCSETFDIDTATSFEDWEAIALLKMFKINRPNKKGLELLPFAINELLESI